MDAELYKKSVEKFYGNESDDLHILVGAVTPDAMEMAQLLLQTDQYGNSYLPALTTLDCSSLAEIYVVAGVFPSFSQARKNGKDLPIPLGYSEHRLGKKKRRVFIFRAS